MRETNLENNLSFIITGSGRCGTRWLAHLLNESKDLTVYHEPLLPFMRKLGRARYAEYIELFEAKRKETGPWGGVSAAACEHIETLLGLGIKVAGLCRDGIFAVRSIRDHQSYLRLEGAIELWVDRNKRLLDSGIPIWRLEDLNENFDSVLSLCQFLDCSIEYPVWQHYAGVPDNRGKHRSGGRLQPGGLSIFYAEAGDVQLALGYEVPIPEQSGNERRSRK